MAFLTARPRLDLPSPARPGFQQGHRRAAVPPAEDSECRRGGKGAGSGRDARSEGDGTRGAGPWKRAFRGGKGDGRRIETPGGGGWGRRPAKQRAKRRT